MTADATSPPLHVAGPDSTLIDAVGCGIWLYDGQDILFVNEALSRITGYSRTELVAPRFFESLIHPDDHDLIVERGRARIRGEAVPDEYEISVIARDGRRVWLHIHGRLIERDGKSCSLVSALDISARKEAERALEFLAGVSAQLGESLDPGETLKRISRLAVPYLGDYSVLDVVDEAGELHRIAGTHRDPVMQARMDANIPDSGRFADSHPIRTVLTTGQSMVLTDDVAERLAVDERHREILRELNPRTYVIVPLAATGGERLGTMGLAWASELPEWQIVLMRRTAEELGRRAADALQQSRLYARAQAAAAEAEFNLLVLDAMFAAAPIAMVFLDREMRIVNINRVAARKSVSIADHIGRRPCEVMPEHWKVVGEHYERVFATAAPVRDIEHSQTHPKSGVETTWVSSYYPVFGGDGELMGVAGVGVEISARKAAEERIRTNEERLRLAQSAARMGTWEWDIPGNTVTWSGELEDVYGIERGSFPGTFEAFLEHVHPDDREAMLASAEHLRAEGWNDIEHRIVGPDGSVRWLAGRGQVFYDEHGQGARAIGVGLDITDRKHVEEELRRANLAKDELLGLVSHELRTPLTEIIGNAQVLRRHETGVPLEGRRMALDDIASAAERLQRLIENMLILSHVEAQTEVDVEPVLLQRLIPRVLSEGTAIGRDVKLDLPEDLPPVLAQPTYVEQILENLLSNARKYAGGAEAVEVRAREEGGRAVVGVLDRGPGIPPEELDSIFTPFFRSTGTAATISGMGLGLAVCRRLAEVQRGQMWAEPREGGGAAIWLALPVADARED